VLFIVFLCVGHRSEAWWICALWTAYYVAMIVVAFHVEIRYRNALVPVVLAGAMGGLAAIRQATAGRRRTAALFGVIAVLGMLGPVACRAGALSRVVAAWLSLRKVDAALSRHDAAAVRAAAIEAASRDPLSARPWIAVGRRLLAVGDLPEAIESFGRAAELRPKSLVPAVVLPRLLAEVGRSSEALEAAQLAAKAEDPSLALAVAWRELPVPQGVEIVLGDNDYGAVRGFLRPLASGRWTGPRAELRLRPGALASRYKVTIEMASPSPSPWSAVSVQVRDLVGTNSRSCVVTREMAPCSLDAKAAPDGSVRVAVISPTWSQYPAVEQGVLVKRMTTSP
jgi:hypothetical protein